MLRPYDFVADSLRAHFGPAPAVGIVLGSGLGRLALALPASVPYAEVGLPSPGVAGHGGRVHFGELGGKRVAAFAGRLHLYEGHSPDVAALQVRALARWGCKTVILTSAVGGCRADLPAGTIGVVSDHLNFQGQNPLRGPNDDALGTRFPDLSNLYSARLRTLARTVEPSLPDVVYAAMPGPNYETPAEIRMLRTLGADVVGMSLVSESIAAGHAGLDVLALAVVANAGAGLHAGALTHVEVTEAMAAASGRLIQLVVALLGKL
ncbi:MAG: purine-nucleoside phosphorylase [Myxococcales bacterium]|nr:purine-nucleoside phosphorylase [Myxococcales bacterium]